MKSISKNVPWLAGAVVGVGLQACMDHRGSSSIPAPPTPLFAPPVSHPLSAAPIDAVAEDFDGDGRVDFAALTIDSEVDVLLAQPNAGFLALPSLPLGTSAKTLTAGDLDGDTLPDIAVAGELGLSWLRNAGGGAFEAPSSFAQDGDPAAVAIADFDDDGVADLATALEGDGVNLRRGLGAGVFDSGATYEAPFHPIALAAGDLDGDGVTDVALAHRIDRFCFSGPLVSLFFGSRAGDLGPAQPHGDPRYATSIALADLNRDGVLDVVAGLGVNSSPCSPPPLRSGAGEGCTETGIILLGVGDGTLEPEYCVPMGFDVRDLAIADLDEDGALDLVAVNRFSSKVSVALGSGDGTFPLTTHYSTGPVPTAIALARVDADTDIDLVIGHAESAAMTVVDGLGSGSFAAPAQVNLEFGAWSAVAEDVDVDGLPDLVALGSSDGVNRKLGVLFGLGQGVFEPARIQDVELPDFYPLHLAAGDFDADQRTDLLALGGSSNAGTWTMLGAGSGVFGAPVALELPQALAGPFAMGDLDQDGKLDLVVGAPELDVLLGSDEPILVAGPSIPSAEGASSIGIVDVDADGVPDLCACNSTGSLVIHPGLGDGSFAAPIPYPIEAACSGTFNQLAVGDVDGDGLRDVAVLTGTDFGCIAEIVLYLGSSDGTLRRMEPVPTDVVGLTAAALADIDDDGRLDLVTSGSGNLELRPGRMDGSFGEPATYFEGGLSSSLQIRDLDRDGDLDVLTVTSTGIIALGGFR